MRFLTLAAAACLGLSAAAAQAAPQAMLLVAGGENLQFRCTGEECLAEATSICLQAERATPRAKTPYELVDEERYGTGRANGLELVGVTAAGAEKVLPLEEMEIIAEREHMAVRFIVAKAALQEHGVDRLELRVAHNVVVAPVWKPGDANPLLEHEIELVMGPLRATAENILNRRRAEVASARILGDMLNDLPRDRVATVAEREAVYKRIVEARSDQPGGLSPQAIALAETALDGCSYIKDEVMWYQAFNTRISRYRSCLGYRHDRLIKGVNESYWDAVKSPGM